MAKKNQAVTSKYTEDWIPVQTIANGMIILDDQTKVTGVKIAPRNIFILDEGEQANVLMNYNFCITKHLHLQLEN